jgi:cyclohexanecarboxylate-CoA ligase
MSRPLKTIHDRYTDSQIADYYENGYWAGSSFTALIAEQATQRPDKVFVLDGTTSLTYREFGERSLRLAVGLARDGIGAGDRVVVQLPNWTEFPLIAAALSRLGAIIVPVMPIYRGDEVGYVIQHSGAVAAVTCGEFRGFDHLGMFEELRRSCPDLRQIYVARSAGSAAGSRPLDDLLVEGDLDGLDTEAGPDSGADDGFLIVYTSGTTSRPKGCFHTFNTVRASAGMIIKGLRYTEDDVQFGPSPITHSTGLVTSVVMPLLVGASSFLMEVWDPAQAHLIIAQHGCTASVTATPFLQMLMAAYDPAVHDPSSLRLWVCAGSPIPGAVVEEAREKFAGCTTLSLYGRSENFTTTMCTVDDDPIRSVTSDGSAFAGCEVVVVDSRGAEAPRGEEGDIAFRGPSHMIEYYNDDEQTAALFTEAGFSRSGDLGRMDADGYVRVTGRLKDIVIRGGMNISAREVEELLVAHPLVAGVAVVGMPDARLGEKVCAYVVLKDPASELTLEEVATFLSQRQVAVQKIPERLELVNALPMTATGKIQKHVLRDDIARKLS